MKRHTRANSGEFFIHVLALFPSLVHEPIVSALEVLGIDCLIDFLAEDINELMTTLTAEGVKLSIKEKRILKNIHEWLIWENNN